MSISTIPSTPTHISLSITSDTICPFCYIGYNRLTRALSLTQQSIPSLTYTIRFSPFELDPTLPRYPTPSKDKKAHYHAKFGEASFTGMEKAMKERGKAEGISFSYGGKVGNTIDSHRIIEKAWVVGGEEAQRKVVERLFRWYFEEEGDIANWEGLSRVVGELGVCGDEGEVMKFLKGGELEGSVREGLRKARERRITGVPFTVINDKFAVSGAQEVETFVEAFKKIANEEM